VRTTGGPLLLYLQGTSPDGVARDAAGASDISNEELAFFVQDKWQPGPVDGELRPSLDGQRMAKTVESGDDGVCRFLTNPRSRRTEPLPISGGVSARGGVVWTSTRAARPSSGNAGIYYARQTASQVASVTSNGIQQKTDFRGHHVHQLRGHARVAKPAAPSAVPAGTFPLFTASACSIATTAILACTPVNVGFDQEWRRPWRRTVDFTIAKGTHLTRS